MEPCVLCLVQRAINAQRHRFKLGDQQFNDLFLLVQPRLRTVECFGQKAVDLVLIHVMILKYLPRTRHLLRRPEHLFCVRHAHVRRKLYLRFIRRG